jgi:hypothetical protein
MAVRGAAAEILDLSKKRRHGAVKVKRKALEYASQNEA